MKINYLIAMQFLLFMSCSSENLKQDKDVIALIDGVKKKLSTGRYDSVIFHVDSILLNSNMQPYWAAELYNLKGNAYFFKGYYQQALESYDASLVLRKDLNDSSKISDSYTNIGMVYSEIENFDKAEYYITNALILQNDRKDTLGLISTYINKGNLAFRNNEVDRAKQFFLEAQDLNKDENDIIKASIENNLGATVKAEKNISSAIDHFGRALNIAVKLNDKKGIAIAKSNIGGCYLELGEYENAYSYFSESMSLHKELRTVPYYLDAYTNLARAQLKMSDLDRAKASLNAALEIAEKNGIDHKKRDVYDLLIHLDTVKGDYKSAIKYYNNFLISMREQLERNFEKQMEYARVNFEIDIAKGENELLKERLISKNRQIIIYLIAVLFLLSLLIVLSLFFKKRSLENKLIANDLLSQIEKLKSELVIGSAVSSIDENNDVWIRSNVDKLWGVAINDSDWNILEAIKNSPLINNQEIADSVNLSLEGVRSSLKKMYRLANLEKRSPNQKLNLIHSILNQLKERN